MQCTIFMVFGISETPIRRLYSSFDPLKNINETTFLLCSHGRSMAVTFQHECDTMMFFLSSTHIYAHMYFFPIYGTQTSCSRRNSTIEQLGFVDGPCRCQFMLDSYNRHLTLQLLRCRDSLSVLTHISGFTYCQGCFVWWQGHDQMVRQSIMMFNS